MRAKLEQSTVLMIEKEKKQPSHQLFARDKHLRSQLQPYTEIFLASQNNTNLRNKQLIG